MDAEQLQGAYLNGLRSVHSDIDESWSDYNVRAHAAGLAEVARQQAEHDAQIADELASLMNNWGHEPKDIAAVIREQFGKVDK